MPPTDKYTFRLDGNFLIRTKCDKCGKGFDMHALANVYQGTYCDDCSKEDRHAD